MIQINGIISLPVSFNEISKPHRANGLAEARRRLAKPACRLLAKGMPKAEGDWFAMKRSMNKPSHSNFQNDHGLLQISTPTQRTTRIKGFTSSPTNFNEISKPHRANGLAEARRRLAKPVCRLLAKGMPKAEGG
ncbi:hypothetical protein [Planococcus sp. ISL-109]|uniref:hypothetical protein n=1 Tax=Planococcus sp. ISL-109 TaxID=2819166 RepID=UPI001BE6CDC1|nr:hypothetical protein [Planococcus sp. ISL-109]MBT2581558.1 hypothetical protein [Planococcus sp. ISL-109]